MKQSEAFEILGVEPGEATPETIKAAFRKACEGSSTIFADGEPVREDECSIFTGFKWVVKKDLS